MFCMSFADEDVQIHHYYWLHWTVVVYVGVGSCKIIMQYQIAIEKRSSISPEWVSGCACHERGKDWAFPQSLDPTRQVWSFHFGRGICHRRELA